MTEERVTQNAKLRINDCPDRGKAGPEPRWCRQTVGPCIYMAEADLADCLLQRSRPAERRDHEP